MVGFEFKTARAFQAGHLPVIGKGHLLRAKVADPITPMAELGRPHHPGGVLTATGEPPVTGQDVAMRSRVDLTLKRGPIGHCSVCSAPNLANLFFRQPQRGGADHRRLVNTPGRARICLSQLLNHTQVIFERHLYPAVQRRN